MEEYLLVIEADAECVKAIIKDAVGNERQRTEKKLESIISEAGWKEVDANEIWISTMYVILNLVKNCGVVSENIQKIRITENKETVVLWGKHSGVPAFSAIFEVSQQLLAEKRDWILKQTEKIGENEEIVFDTVASWIAYRLTGAYIEKNILQSENESYIMYGDTDPAHFFGREIPVVSISEGV